MKRLLLIVAFVTCLVPALRGADLNLYQFDEQRPADGIYDPGDWIRGPAKSNLVRELKSIKDSSGIDVLVAVVEKPGEADPQKIAEELADRWGYHGGRALVLCVPDRKDSPWIAISGLIRADIPRPTLDAITAKAKQRARTDATVHESARRAVESLGEDLRYAVARSIRGTKNPTPMAAPSLKDLTFLLLRSLQKILTIIGVTGAVLVVIGFAIYRIWKNVRLALTPKIFPDVSWKPRFGAPYAGISYTHSSKRKANRAHDP